MAWQLNVTLLYKQGASQPVVDGRISPIFTPKVERIDGRSDPTLVVRCTVVWSIPTSTKNLKSHHEVTGNIPHGNSTCPAFFGSAFFGVCSFRGSHNKNLQDANSNRLAWKCPSPGDKPRYQVANMWNCLAKILGNFL